MLEGIAEGIVEGICHVTGRLLLPVLTFGKVRPEGLVSPGRYPWHGYKTAPNGRIVASINATTGAGMIFCFIVIGVAGVVTYKAVCS